MKNKNSIVPKQFPDVPEVNTCKNIKAYTSLLDEGIPSSIVNEMVAQYHTPKSIFPPMLDLTEKSIKSKIKQKELFTGNQADALLELQGIFELARIIFGSTDPFITWLGSTDAATNKKRMELLVIPTGRRYIKDELYRIAHGYVY